MDDFSKFRKEEGLTWIIPKVNHLLKKEMENRIREYNLSLGQWITLSRIYKMEGSNQKELASASLRDSAGITRILNSLEEKGLVKREVSTTDKREYNIFITKKGKILYKKTEKILFEYNNEINSIFSKSELKKYNSLLEKLFSELK